MRRTAVAAATAGVLAATLTACGSSSSSKADAKSTDLTVLAASSLTDVFKTAGAAYEKSHPGVHLRFSYAGSQQLAAQVKQGAPADVLATADTKTMDGLKGETTGARTLFAKNRLVIAVGKGNPKKVAALKDLADSTLEVVLAAPQVPVGRYAQQVLSRQKLHVKPVSQEPNVRAVLSKVELGEADAGLVYRTDAATAPGKVRAIDIPDAQNAVADYPASALKGSQHLKAAEEFTAWLKTAKAQTILRKAGFQQP
jgi:molybdate transport system substrate-binding protein